MRKFFYFLLAAMTMMFAACGDGNEPTIDDNGALKGKFSVDDKGTQVQFSRGNLQYVGTWQFATNQWDIFGDTQADNHRDLFGWGTGKAPNNVSTENSNYANYREWGANPITNGGNADSLWRTLTDTEWQYLFFTRTDAATLFALGSVNGVDGTILLPDDWTCPSGVSFTASTTKGLAAEGTWYYHNDNKDNFTHNTYTATQWKKMEGAGAVFLPAASSRTGTVMSTNPLGSHGNYWASTPYGTNDAYRLYFFSTNLSPRETCSRKIGFSVRLVQEVKK